MSLLQAKGRYAAVVSCQLSVVGRKGTTEN
jgi:hypothetical protein